MLTIQTKLSATNQQRQTIDYDLEFIEDGQTIELVSIGMVKTLATGEIEEYYAINSECNWSKSGDWVLKNVLLPLGIDRTGLLPTVSSTTLKALKTKQEIARELILFLLGHEQAQNCFDWTLEQLKQVESNIKSELWAYYAAYDHVALCQLFGTMMELPKCLPMYTMDIKQECIRLGDPRLPLQEEDEHNALADARWNKIARVFLLNYAGQ